MSKFAERVKELRVEKGLSQAELAKAIGVTQSIVARWEADLRIPKMDSIIALTEFFKISSDYLIGIVD